MPNVAGLAGIFIALAMVLPNACMAETDERLDALVYSRIVDGECEIGLFDAATGSASTLSLLPECPQQLFLSGPIPTMFFVSGGNVTKIDLHERFAIAEVAPLPELDITSYTDDVIEKLHPSVIEAMHSTSMEPRVIGYLANGSFAIDLKLELSLGGSFDYLVVYDGGVWRVAASGGCSNWELDCKFAVLPGRSTEMYDWPDEQLVQYAPVATNAFLVRDDDQRKQVEDGQAGYLVRNFDINGAKSTIRVWTSPSAHYDLVYPFEITIEHEAGVTDICKEQCRAALAGRYLLAQRFWGGTLELYDVASGKTVLGEVVNAMWIRVDGRGHD
jgi:hypothetical protein